MKRYIKEHKIVVVAVFLMLVIIVLAFLVKMTFLSNSGNAVYGNRLDGIENYAVDNELNEVKSFFTSNQRVKNVDTDIRGKIIYINVEVDKDMANEDIQTLCTESLTKFKDDQKEYYDIQYIVKREGLSPYLGSKSASKTVIAWANFSYNNEEENQDTEGE